jgi:RNA polymerase sigma-70 factor (ECF subfamily)
MGDERRIDAAGEGPLEPPPPLANAASAAAHELERPIRELLARGETRAAITALSKLYGDVVYSYCRRVVRNADLAEDLLQQTFLAAHKDIGHFEGRALLKSWLIGIAHNRSLDAMRVHQRNASRVEHDDDAIDLASSDGVDAREQVAQGRLSRALELCLRKLSIAVRMTVILRFQHGLSYEEMGDILEERPGTLQARVTRALPALRECLEDKGMSL